MIPMTTYSAIMQQDEITEDTSEATESVEGTTEEEAGTIQVPAVDELPTTARYRLSTTEEM